jgi:hypothetical protein
MYEKPDMGMSLHDGVPGTLGGLVPFGISLFTTTAGPSTRGSPAGIVTDLDRLPCCNIDPPPPHLGMYVCIIINNGSTVVIARNVS